MKKLVSFIKENRTGFKAISMILVLALMVQTMSLAVTAITESGLSLEEMFSTDDSTETMPSIVGEVESNRDRYTKVYELADGSFYEVVSNKPIHKNVGGQWEEPANNLDVPESVDEVTSYCNELAESISEEQNNGGISTLSYIEDDPEEYIVEEAYIIERSDGCVSEYEDLDTFTYMLLNLNNEGLSLSNTNRLLINQSLHIRYEDNGFFGNNPKMLINVISEDWYINENEQVYDSDGFSVNDNNNKLQIEESVIGTDLIFASNDTECEFDITEISHKWSKGIVDNNGLYVSLTGEFCWAKITDCYLTRRFLIIDAYDQDLTYHTIDMDYAGQVLVNDLTNTITILRNEMYYPTENMPINLYRYFDFSKTYTDLNPAGIGTHWNYESPIIAEKSDRIAWSAFDGRTIRFKPSEMDSTKWYPENSKEYELNLNGADITTAEYDGITINSSDGLTYTFGAVGKIKKIEDGKGNYIFVKYNGIDEPTESSPQDYITTIENNSGYRYYFEYSNDYNLDELQDSGKFALNRIYYQKNTGPNQYSTVNIDGVDAVMTYVYTLLPDGNLALSKVTYPHDSQTPERDWLTVEYLYENGRLVGVVDIDKRKLQINYSTEIPDYANQTVANPDAKKVVDNYPSAFSFEELVINNDYTDDMPDEQKYLSVPKSLLKIDRTNTYHRVFENEFKEVETLHYSKEFQLLYYTNNDGNDFYADYKSENGKHYVSQIVSPEKPLEESAKKLKFDTFENNVDDLNSAWSNFDNDAELVSGAINGRGNNYVRMLGSVNSGKYIAQTAKIDGQAGDIFVVGGYAMSKDASTNQEQFFGIEVYEIVIGRREQEVPGDLLCTLTFDPTMDDEVQFRLGAFKLNKDTEKVYYKIMYSNQTGEAKFDDLLLYKSSEKNVDFFDAPVTVNDNRNTESISVPSTSSDATVIDDSNENYFSIESTDNNNITTKFNYNKETGFLEQKRVETTDDDSLDIVDEYSYDALGALTEVSRVVGFTQNENNEDTLIKNTTNYEYEYGRISSVIHNNMTYQFNYNSYGDLESITVDLNSTEEIPVISYDYTDDAYRNVNKIVYSDYVLEYEYDLKGKITSISERSTLSSDLVQLYSYEYDEISGDLCKITDYVSRRIMKYSDNLFEVYKLAENSIDEDELLYSKSITKNTNTQEIVAEDISIFSSDYSKAINTPSYDDETKTTTYSSSTTTNIGYSVIVNSQAACDYFGRITSSSVSAYKQNGPNDDVIRHSILNESTYTDDIEGNSTTNLLKTFSSTIRRGDTNSNDILNEFSTEYSYDKAGRITHIFYKQNDDEKALAFYYKYDVAGQLVKEVDCLKQTYTEYSYDSYGNITQKAIYSLLDTYTENGEYFVNLKEDGTKYDSITDIDYTYYENYSDVLGYYNGKDISCDNYGNPNKYYRIDGDKEETFILDWNGNQLHTVKLENDTSVYEYKYDDEGRRTQKILYSTYTPDNPNGNIAEMIMDYIWDNNKIMGYRIEFPSDNTSIIIDAAILYDELDDPIGLKYCISGFTDGEDEQNLSNEDIFWFIKDGQGKIVAIFSEKSDYMIGCSYTADGKLEINDSGDFVSELNQRIEEADDFRSGLLIALSAVLAIQFSTMISADATQVTHSNSIMDIETGLYYCQNRYYSPEYGRFINIGNIEEVVDDLENPFNSNPFVYCNNDPINQRDTSIKSKSSSTAVGIQAELSKSIFSFSGSVGIEFVYEPIKDELYAYYYSDAKSNIDYTQKAVEHINNVLGSIPFSATTSLKGLASNFKINNSLSLSYFSVQNDKTFVWPNSYQNTVRVTAKKINGYRGYAIYGNGYNSKGVCFYPTTNVGFSFNDLTVKYTKLEVNFPALKNYLATNRNDIIATIK